MVKRNNTQDLIDLAVMSNDIKYIKEDVKSIKESMEFEYVTKIEFEPIKRIVYGMVSILLLSVIGAVIKLIFIK